MDDQYGRPFLCYQRASKEGEVLFVKGFLLIDFYAVVQA